MRAHSCRLFGGIAVLTMAMLGGCSDEAPEGASLTGDDALTTAQPTPPARPTSSPAQPSSSAVPTSELEKQIHDATTKFYDAVNAAYETLDTAPIKALVVPGSGAASRYIKYIDSVKSKGHRFVVDEGYEVRDFELAKQDADEHTEAATFTLASGRAKEIDANGKTVEEFEPESARLRIEFQKVEGRWLVLSQR